MDGQELNESGRKENKDPLYCFDRPFWNLVLIANPLGREAILYRAKLTSGYHPNDKGALSNDYYSISLRYPGN